MFRWFTREKPSIKPEEDEFIIIDTDIEVPEVPEVPEFECKYFTQDEIWERNENGEQNNTVHVECIEDDTNDPTHDIHYREPIVEEHPTPDTKKKDHDGPVFFTNDYMILPSPTEDALEKQLRYMISFMLSFEIIIDRCVAELCHL
jgi:hypothetical protein